MEIRPSPWTGHLSPHAAQGIFAQCTDDNFGPLPTCNADKGFNLRSLANYIISQCEKTLNETNILDQGFQEHFMNLLIRTELGDMSSFAASSMFSTVEHAGGGSKCLPGPSRRFGSQVDS